MNFVSLRNRSASARLPLAALLLGLALACTLPRSALAQSGQWWTTVPGESATTLALALYPRDARARQAFIDFVLQNNPGVYGAGSGRAASSPLPGDTALLVPTPGQVVRTSVRLPAAGTSTRAASTASAPASVARPAADNAPGTAQATSGTAADSIGDRLMVQRDESDSPLLLAMVEADDARELMLAEAVDRSINRQLELLERMRELEAMQSNMHAILSAELASDAILAQATTRPAAPESTPAATPRTPQPSAPTENGLASGSGLAETDRTLAWALLAVAGLLGLWLIHRLTAPAATHPARPSPARPAAVRDTEHTLPPVLAHARPTPIEEKPTLAATDPASAVSSDDALPAPFAPRPATTDMPVSDSIEDHESAVELAEIMESFGRVHGAAATLAEFIRSNPHQAITPWLKLMDLHQKTGQRAEFEALARELNRAFNVAIITWDNYQRVHWLSDDSLERYPHVVGELTQHWRTRRGQAYIDHLLRDNRHGTREGFTLPVIEELLLLASVLDEQLGRYVPPTTSGGRSQG